MLWIKDQALTMIGATSTNACRKYREASLAKHLKIEAGGDVGRQGLTE